MQITRTVDDGIRIYSKPLLAVYDLLVFNILSPFVWRCHAKIYFELYWKHMTRNHADIGVGTAHILNRCKYKPGEVRIGLFDLRANCLVFAARRLSRFKPETYQTNVLEPIQVNSRGFDSVAMGGLLHCLPGEMASKGLVFDSIQPMLNKGGCVFGYTILNKEVNKTGMSRFVYFLLQKLKVINGLEDSASQLLFEIEKRFSNCSVKVIGCVAIFWAGSPTDPESKR